MTGPAAVRPLVGVALINTERKRQINVEGWTPEHDDENHASSQLAWAALCYIAAAAGSVVYRMEQHGRYVHFEDPWPWEPRFDKRKKQEATPLKTRIRQLVKAGALIAAEIDRLRGLEP